MHRKHLRRATALGLVLACQATPRAAAQAPGAASLGRPIATGAPAATLERPVPLPTAPAPPPFPAPPVTRVGYQDQPPAPVVRGQAPDGPYQSLYQPPPP